MEFTGVSDQYRERAMPLTRRVTSLKYLLALALASTPLLARHAPDPAFKTLDGQTRKLSALHGQIVVVNFWATWCGPCQEELPRLKQIAASYAGKPVSFVYISIDAPRDRSKIPTALARLHVDFDSWVGADTDTLGRFGLGEIVPGTLILDENGEPVARIMGEAREDDVRTPVDWLLGGKTGPAPASMTKRY
jgi:thiol-disulfide isomerase/thioredoxin